MPLKKQDKEFLRIISALAECNPFLPRRFELEKAALGKDYKDVGLVWSHQINDNIHYNVIRIYDKVSGMLPTVFEDVKSGANKEETDLYIDFILYFLYEKYRDPLTEIATRSRLSEGNPAVYFYDDFQSDFHHYFSVI